MEQEENCLDLSYELINWDENMTSEEERVIQGLWEISKRSIRLPG